MTRARSLIATEETEFIELRAWKEVKGSSFMFFMYLRDVYQHSNADAGRLTNSRVFFTNPFTRWAVFVSSQDMHIPHHLSRRSRTIGSAGCTSY